MTNPTGVILDGNCGERIWLAGFDEKAALLEKAGIHPAPDYTEDGRATRYEYHADHDFIALNIPNKEDLFGPQMHIEVFFTADMLAVFCDNADFTRRLQRELDTQRPEELTCNRSLYLLFTCVLAQDARSLAILEDEIAQMEEQVIGDRPKDLNTGMIDMRKRLLVLKRYYEALFDLLQDLEENQNGFITKAMLRYFRLHTNRVDRLSHLVVNLRDYLTQVREVYQNQIDINLNKTMQLFTVITVIFLPLTLIVGWYGMNLKMPELQWPYTYPVVAIVSVLVVVFCLWYFKRKDWF